MVQDKQSKLYHISRISLFSAVGILLIGSIIIVVVDEKDRVAETEKLNQKLSELQKQLNSTKDYITGGQGYCYMNLDSISPTGDATIVVVNDGDNPVYNVSLRVWDPADYGKEAEGIKTIEEFLQRSFQTNVGDMPAHSARMVGRFQFSFAEKKSFVATIMSNNKYITEQLQCRYINGAWARAFRVFDGRDTVESKLLMEKSDQNFPRDANQKLSWD